MGVYLPPCPSGLLDEQRGNPLLGREVVFHQAAWEPVSTLLSGPTTPLSPNDPSPRRDSERVWWGLASACCSCQRSLVPPATRFPPPPGGELRGVQWDDRRVAGFREGRRVVKKSLAVHLPPSETTFFYHLLWDKDLFATAEKNHREPVKGFRSALSSHQVY